MDRFEIVVCRSNGEDVFPSIIGKMAHGMVKMVTDGRSSMYFQKAHTINCTKKGERVSAERSYIKEARDMKNKLNGGNEMSASEQDCLSMLVSIENSLTLLFSSRFFYREFVNIIEARAFLREGNHFLTWIADNYLFSASIALRRLLDKGRDTISLIQIINALKSNSYLLSRERYIRGFVDDSGFDENDANLFFDQIAGAGANCFDIERINSGIKEIQNVWKRLKTYINERVAHEARITTPDLPTVSDLDICIDKIAEISKSIIEVLRFRSVTSFTPVIQYPWKRIFFNPWINEIEVKRSE